VKLANPHEGRITDIFSYATKDTLEILIGESLVFVPQHIPFVVPRQNDPIHSALLNHFRETVYEQQIMNFYERL
jgi:hypothetical protein